MGQYEGLTEYLFALRVKKTSAPLCRFGMTLSRINSFPPNTRVTYDRFPALGSYAAIQYFLAWSQAMVPDAFYYESHQEGVEASGFLLSAGIISRGYNVWMVLTEAKPMTVTLENVTPLVQYHEAGNIYLLVDTEDTFKIVLEEIENWSAHKGVGNPLSNQR